MLTSGGLQDRNLGAIVQLTRALGNACIDNEANVNVCLAFDGLLKSSLTLLSHKETFRFGCGILVNVTVENEAAQSLLAEADALFVVWRCLNDGVTEDCSEKINACSLIGNIVESDLGSIKFCSVDGEQKSLMGKIVQALVDNPNGELQYALTTILESACEKPTFQTALVSQVKAFSGLLDLIELNLHPLSHAMSRIIAAVSLHDEVMEILLDDDETVLRLRRWLSAGGEDKRYSEIRMNAALCLGNLARSDHSCERLVFSMEIARPLLAVAEDDLNFIEYAIASKSDLKVQVQSLFAVLGAFRNLSCAPRCKSFLGEIGLVGYLSRVVETPGIKVLYQVCAVIAKNLCFPDCFANALRVCVLPDLTANAGRPLLSSLMEFVKGATGENDLGLRTESARTVLNIIKLAYTAEPTTQSTLIDALTKNEALFAVLQLLTGKVVQIAETASKVEEPWTHHHVSFEQILSDGQTFPTLQKDALVAALLYCAMDKRVAAALCAWAPVYISLLYYIISGKSVDCGEIFGLKSHKLLQEKPSLTGEAAKAVRQPVEYTLPTKMLAVLLLQKLCSTSVDLSRSLQQSLLKLISATRNTTLLECSSSSTDLAAVNDDYISNVDKATKESLVIELDKLGVALAANNENVAGEVDSEIF